MKLIVEATPTGVKVEAAEVKGASCVESVRMLTEHLGLKVSEANVEIKPEYHELVGEQTQRLDAATG